MPKVNLKVKLKSKTENTKYEVIGNINKEKQLITYFEPTNEKTKVQYFYRKNKLVRDNKNLNMTYTFDLKKETNGVLYIKALRKNLYVNVKTKQLEINNHNVQMIFSVEQEEFKYEIELKED